MIDWNWPSSTRFCLKFISCLVSTFACDATPWILLCPSRSPAIITIKMKMILNCILDLELKLNWIFNPDNRLNTTPNAYCIGYTRWLTLEADYGLYTMERSFFHKWFLLIQSIDQDSYIAYFMLIPFAWFEFQFCKTWKPLCFIQLRWNTRRIQIHDRCQVISRFPYRLQGIS